MILTTKEFIKEVEKLELYVDKSEKFGHILVIDGDHRLVAYVKNNDKCQFSTAFASFDNLLEPIQRKLIELIGMYASTPPDKREEPQKFYMKFKLPTNYSDDFLNLNTTFDWFEISTKSNLDKFQTQFTQKEIDEIKERFNTNLDDFEQIPVEEDEEIE